MVGMHVTSEIVVLAGSMAPVLFIVVGLSVAALVLWWQWW